MSRDLHGLTRLENNARVRPLLIEDDRNGYLILGLLRLRRAKRCLPAATFLVAPWQGIQRSSQAAVKELVPVPQQG